MGLPQPGGVVRQILKERPVLLAGFACAAEPIPPCQCPLTFGEGPLREYRPVVFGNNVAGPQTASRSYYDMLTDEVPAFRYKKRIGVIPRVD